MPVKEVDVRRAREMQEAEGYTYVDVRSIPEYEQGHPAGGVNVPLLHLDQTAGQMRPNPEFLAVMQAGFSKTAKLVVGCQMGGRSARAAEMLAAEGYEHVYNVRGGFGGSFDRQTGNVVDIGWAQAGLPVETQAAPGSTYTELRGKLTGR